MGRWVRGFNLMYKQLERRAGSISFEFDAAAGKVAYPTADVCSFGETLYEIAEADALYPSVDNGIQRYCFTGSDHGGTRFGKTAWRCRIWSGWSY